MTDANTLRRLNKLWKERHKHDEALATESDLLILKEIIERDSDASAQQEGAYLHLTRSANQTIATSGEAVSWDTQYSLIPPVGFVDPTLPTTAVEISRRGYYDIAVDFEWSTFLDGGAVTIVRNRDGVGTTIWPTSADPGIWDSPMGQRFSSIAPAIPLQVGDTISVRVDHGDAASQTLASASLVVYLVDSISVQSSASASAYRELVLSHGPIAYWRLGELSGTTAVDETGNGHTGTYQNTPALGVAGLISGTDTAVSFTRDASNPEHVFYNTDLTPFNVSSITVEAWVNPGSVGADAQMIVCRDNGINTQRVFVFRVDGSTGFISFHVLDNGGGTLATLVGVTDVRLGTHYVAVTYDGTTCRLYVDGVEDASDTLSAALETGSTAPVRLAVRGPGDSTFGGTLDEVAVYGRVLSATEISDHYDAGTV